MSGSSRRSFLKTVTSGTLGLGLTGLGTMSCSALDPVPSYLKEYGSLYRNDPKKAALQWFKDAKFGLFMHYGISSLLGRGEWVLYRENLPLDKYIKLKDEFTAAHFDADFITDMALEAGMRYVNITSRHHDSFNLFESKVSDFSSVNSPAKRDLVGELADQCQKKGLGLFLYYSYALDWWHPYFYPRKYNRIARPDYKDPQSVYKWRKDEDFQYYIEFVHAQIKELLTNYGPLAGIWFDPIMGYYGQPELFPIAETYAMIRQLQPQTLISFKQGATGTEDFAAPERSGHSLAERVRQVFGDKNAKIAEHAWESNKNKHNEICDTMQPGAWGYRKLDDNSHHSSLKVIQMLVSAVSRNFNLLLNTGPLPDGGIHVADVKSFRETGQWLKKNGESVYKTEGGPFLATNFSTSTHKKDLLYLHLFNFPGGKIKLSVPENSVQSVHHPRQEKIDTEYKQNMLHIHVPDLKAADPDFIIRLKMNNQMDYSELQGRTIEFDIPLRYKNITLKNTPSPKYLGRGINTLQDGIRGDTDPNSGHWLGFEAADFDAVIDLGTEKEINRIECGFLQNQNSWIFLPVKVQFYAAQNNSKWKLLSTQKSLNKRDDQVRTKNVQHSNNNVSARYVKIVAVNQNKCPDWHPGAGGKAWLFVDEITIE